MRALVIALLMLVPASALSQPLPGTQPLAEPGDLAAKMVAGISRYLDQATAASPAKRAAEWKRRFAAGEASALRSYREELRNALGVEGLPDLPRFEISAPADPGKPVDSEVARGAGYRVFQARWDAGGGLEMTGLWLQTDDPVLKVVTIPDCSNTPEQLVGLEPGIPAPEQFARRLAENRCSVLIPLLIDRSSRLSQIPGRPTDIPHREFIQRAAFEFGHTLAGFEVQGVLAGVQCLRSASRANGKPLPVALIGCGEGGRIALYAAALDGAVPALVSGSFGPREGTWKEPIDRNSFALLNSLGDAELAVLTGRLIVESARQPEWKMPGQAERAGGKAAPGEISTPPLDAVKAEVDRAGSLSSSVPGAKSRGHIRLVVSRDGTGPPASDAALQELLGTFGIRAPAAISRRAPVKTASYQPLSIDRQFRSCLDKTQRLMRESPAARVQFWSRAAATDPAAWVETARWYREQLWDKVIGRLPSPEIPLNPRSRPLYDEPKFRGYEVALDVYPEVFAYGILLVPKGLKDGEKRPVVVCQHGLEGRPTDVANPRLDHPAYHRYACRLAERGFVVFAPQNPYIGGDAFRSLQRKANPLGLSLFSFIVRQHERILEWLGAQPYVDARRIGFYGLSYGGKTAMRVPALVEGYALSICSADYNEWIWKNSSAESPYSYLFTNEYEMPEWNLGNTFNYAELSWLIAPRPFMVERGHQDGVAPDEWVAYEFARTRRKYVQLGIPERTEIEFFNGPHTINGVGTFRFLEKNLKWAGSGD